MPLMVILEKGAPKWMDISFSNLRNHYQCVRMQNDRVGISYWMLEFGIFGRCFPWICMGGIQEIRRHFPRREATLSSVAATPVCPVNINTFLVIFSLLCGPTWVEFSTRHNPVFLLSNYDLEEIGAVKTMIYRRDKKVLRVPCMLFVLISKIK